MSCTKYVAMHFNKIMLAPGTGSTNLKRLASDVIPAKPPNTQMCSYNK